MKCDFEPGPVFSPRYGRRILGGGLAQFRARSGQSGTEARRGPTSSANRPIPGIRLEAATTIAYGLGTLKHTKTEAEPIDKKHLLKEIETRWRELWPRLLVFGHSIAFSNPWCARVSGEDLVREAVLRVARGTRVWDPEASSLDSFLFGVVMSCASERPRDNENRIPNLDYELLDDGIESHEQPHQDVLHRERNNELSDFIESLRNDPPAYNVASYMAKFAVHEPDQLSTILVMDKDKVVATKRRIIRRAVRWRRSVKEVDDRYRTQSDE